MKGSLSKDLIHRFILDFWNLTIDQNASGGEKQNVDVENQWMKQN